MANHATADVPPYHEALRTTLQAVNELGGSASIGEIVETVIKRQRSVTPSRRAYRCLGECAASIGRGGPKSCLADVSP